jgi:hypothetical protein
LIRRPRTDEPEEGGSDLKRRTSTKLVVPYIGELRDLDARMVRLAEVPGHTL